MTNAEQSCTHTHTHEAKTVIDTHSRLRTPTNRSTIYMHTFTSSKCSEKHGRLLRLVEWGKVSASWFKYRFDLRLLGEPNSGRFMTRYSASFRTDVCCYVLFSFFINNKPNRKPTHCLHTTDRTNPIRRLVEVVLNP